ncbi:MAG: hypothetical protein DU429_08635 [Candidatus Tokpelaia sp.]|nr:MAG: hypothetical protein DU429_08635 [Candidatus Tokpelaia sp.]KAA6206525.1 MAG: hypothetical protein DU430_00020 [Candidatus Tokpelaia sp.]
MASPGAILLPCFCARQNHDYRKRRPGGTAIWPKKPIMAERAANRERRSRRSPAVCIGIISEEKGSLAEGQSDNL